jgi:type IV pilus assembly protein PilC
VASAEATGTLDVILNRLANHKEKTEKLKSNIKKALTYPAAVMLLALLVSAILLIEVVPVFAETFRGFGTELPAFTLFVLGLSDALTTWWLLIVCAVSATLIGFREAHFRNSEFAYAVDGIILKLPVIGLITYHSVIARFARTLATTLAAGLPIIEALDSTADAAGNRPYQKAILQLRNEVISGISLQQAMNNNTMFPRLLQQMTAIGEESGALDEMLANVASHYEAAVVSAIDNFTSLIEPLMMAVLGVLVGGLLIAMYLPIFQLGNVV